MAQQAREADRSTAPDRKKTLGSARIFGTWTWDGAGECFTLDPGSAEVLLGNPRLSGKPILRELACIQLEPDDAGRLLSTLSEVDVDGPLRVAVRVQSTAGERHLELNGWISRETSGAITGAGVVLDPAARGPKQSSPTEVMAHLAFAAKLCSQARDAADDIGDEQHSDMIDQILSKLGQALSLESRPGSLDS